jgi:hypothetical protein
MVLPGLIDIHTHLDKGHIWPRQPNLTGDFLGASIATSADAPRWTPTDIRAHGLRAGDGLRAWRCCRAINTTAPDYGRLDDLMHPTVDAAPLRGPDPDRPSAA